MNQITSTAAPEANAGSNLDQLEIHLQGRLSGRVRDLQILLLERGIVLRGFARTYYAKQLAQHVLMLETQIPILANEIEVG